MTCGPVSLPGAKGRRLREEHGAQSHGLGLDPHWNFSTSASVSSSAQGILHCLVRGRLCTAQHLAQPGQVASLFLLSPAHSYTPCCSLPCCCRQGRGWAGQLQSLASRDERPGHLTGPPLGGGVCSLYHWICPARPTHRALLSPGTQSEYERGQNGLRIYKNRYKWQTFKQINMMCLHSDKDKQTILALGAKIILLVWQWFNRQKVPWTLLQEHAKLVQLGAQINGLCNGWVRRPLPCKTERCN